VILSRIPTKPAQILRDRGIMGAAPIAHTTDDANPKRGWK
jgi:hypothetical protein